MYTRAYVKHRLDRSVRRHVQIVSFIIVLNRCIHGFMQTHFNTVFMDIHIGLKLRYICVSNVYKDVLK